MKIIHKIAIVLSILIMSIPASAEEPVVTQTVMPFFQALKEGDVKAIETFIADPLYSKIKVLLKDNKSYPDHLRKFYSGTSAEIAAISKLKSGEYIVDLRIISPSKTADVTRLRIAENKKGNWKIVDQILVR